MSNKSVRLGDIIIDPAYQVRKRTSSRKVREYTAAMDNGDVFPPITIEADTMKIVDGFTRYEAYKRTFDPDYKVPATVNAFDKPGDRIAYAAKRNMQNGYSLDQWERENVVLSLKAHGFKPSDIAPVVNWNIVRVEDYVGIIVSRGTKKKAVKRDTPDEPTTTEPTDTTKSSQVPSKGGLSHLRGETLPESVTDNIRDHYTGHSARFVARQLLYRISDETVNVNDPHEMEQLTQLYIALGAFLTKHNQGGAA